VLPTNWSIASLPTGITVSYSASGTAVAADGTSVNYIDVTVSGTAGASGFLNIKPNPSSSTIAAFVGQTWNTSVYLQLISGSVTSISPTWQLQELNSSQTFLQESNIGGLGSLVVGWQFDRYNVSRVLTESATAFVTCRWGHSLVSGTAYSYTLRIGSPQLERFSIPTPMIATSTGAVTRLNESTNVVGLPPDFSVSRNTGATRVGPNGLIEAGNTNLALRSEEFNNAFHFPFNLNAFGSGSVANTTATLDPYGTNFADYIQENSVSGVAHSIIDVFAGNVSGTTYTWSVFAKAAERTIINLLNNGGGGGSATFNLTTGVATLIVAGVSASMQNYGNGWWRCILTYISATNGNHNVQIRLCDASGNFSYNGTGNQGAYIFGAQLEVGSTASEYIPTTTVARTRFAGVTVDGTIAANIPRIDWLGQSCPALLVEPSAQNLALQSAGFQVSGNWAPTNISVSTGTTAAFTAPDGSTDADLLTATANGSARIIQSFSFVSGTTYTYSAFAKAGSGFFGLTMENGGVASGAAVIWNLNTGAVAVSGTQGTGYALQSQGIENYGNGWYRCRMTVLMSVSVTGNIRANTADGTMSSTVIQSASGNTAYVWGAQVEVGSVATTYIPTTTAAVTRAADVISASGALVSGLIGQTEGTIYAEVDYQNFGTVTQTIINLISDLNNRIAINVLRSGANNVFQVFVSDSGSGVVNITSTIASAGVYKIALGYKLDDYALYINGALIGTDLNAGVPSMNSIQLGSISSVSQFNNRIRSVAIYTTRLSNTELANLTRLT
jgi:hypothetical protein